MTFYQTKVASTKLQLRLSEGFYHLTYSNIIHDFGCPMDAYINKHIPIMKLFKQKNKQFKNILNCNVITCDDS